MPSAPGALDLLRQQHPKEPPHLDPHIVWLIPTILSPSKDGLNAARLCDAAGLTQEQLAVRAGMSQQYISDLERGKLNPTIVTLYELATALGVGVVELVRED
jgi:DNA-binding XRE family transcriptional regulator